MDEPTRNRLDWIVGLTMVAVILATGIWLGSERAGFGAPGGASG